jgi:hypothetical protein
MMYLNETSGAIELREAEQPWGPWSDPISVVNRSGDNAGCYGAYLHPAFYQDNGRTIYFNMSLWVPYNVFLMKATLVKYTGILEPQLWESYQ